MPRSRTHGKDNGPQRVEPRARPLVEFLASSAPAIPLHEILERSHVLELLDQLEEIIASAPAFPVGGRIVASRQQLLNLIDGIRLEHEAMRLAADVSTAREA